MKPKNLSAVFQIQAPARKDPWSGVRLFEHDKCPLSERVIAARECGERCAQLHFAGDSEPKHIGTGLVRCRGPPLGELPILARQL